MIDIVLSLNEKEILKNLKSGIPVSPFSLKISETELTRCAENLKKYGLISFSYDKEALYIGRPINFELTKAGENFNPYK